MKISSALQAWAQRQKIQVTYKEEIPSTNSFAKEFNHLNDSVIVTDYQPQGRGRGKNSWSSPKPGTGLLSSWVFLKDFSPQPILSPLVGFAVFHSLKTTWNLKNMSLKAPNDIYIKDKKVCGVLIEIETQGVLNKIIIGIGLNILDKPKLPIATDLQTHIKNKITSKDLEKFFNQLFISLNDALVESQKTTLSDKKCKLILDALNLNPSLEEKYTKVFPDGSLQIGKNRKNWSEL